MLWWAAPKRGCANSTGSRYDLKARRHLDEIARRYWNVKESEA